MHHVNWRKISSLLRCKQIITAAFKATSEQNGTTEIEVPHSVLIFNFNLLNSLLVLNDDSRFQPGAELTGNARYTFRVLNSILCFMLNIVFNQSKLMDPRVL